VITKVGDNSQLLCHYEAEHPFTRLVWKPWHQVSQRSFFKFA